MPIYEFRCSNCGKQFEILVSIGNEKNVTCLDCGSNNVCKLVSTFGIGGKNSRLNTSSSGCTTCSATSCSTCK